MSNIKTLLIGESWSVHVVETKGSDVFTYDYYGEGIEFIKPVLSEPGFEFEHMPSHRVAFDFPATAEGLKKYDVIIVSDVGANTFLIPYNTFLNSEKSPNKLQILKDYVLGGGGLCMAGGYLTYMGMEAKGKYKDSILEEVLPVDFLPYDDRMEHPEGFSVDIDEKKHPVLKGLPSKLGDFLGYNKALVKAGCESVADAFGDPFIAVGSFGKGRSLAIATDIAPHWASAEFCTGKDYRILWHNIVTWLAGRD